MYAFVLSGLGTAALLLLGYRSAALAMELDSASGDSPGGILLNGIVNSIGSGPVMAVVGVAAFVLFFFLFSRRIVNELQNLARGIERMAEGELSHRLEVTSSDEFGRMADGLNRMAERLERSIEEERAAAKAKNELITGVSHDLRTPLTSILGFLEYVEKDRYRDEIELRYYVNIAYEKALTLKKLIDDLFEYTRLSGGSPRIFVPLNLGRLVRQAAEEAAPMLEAAGMEYRVNAAEEELRIQASPGELARVLENLLSNAVRYGSSGRWVELDVSRENDRARVAVSNFGDPIPESDLPYIFDRFYRVDASRSQRTGGSGLGLAIVRTIVEQHGGTVEALSRPGRTDFVMRFPLARDRED
ncbi:HAMP domain-containing sensor histidine kinase [Saccharibacillus sp. CPCC 101409]|nr:HAMP domain-containing sensor histidine kinase [Saccharibacillus sp. CPCC 101409]MDO3411106.1 HAMP domain-containing sensor histidine kinase [Saccharibacillus sp. CPCC 101409]